MNTSECGRTSVDILLPTCNRLESLIMCLSGVAGQSCNHFRLIVADQSEHPAGNNPVVQSLIRILEARGSTVEWHYRAPSKGIAEQRDFLLRQATAQYVLFLDDDVWMEPQTLETMLKTIQNEKCGFVGAFPNGLSYRDDFRPQQEHIEFFEGRVTPETVSPDSPEWERNVLHRAANLYHVSLTIPSGQRRLYKVAWIAACILYDREKLMQIGGFAFWDRLPRYQSGEEVLVQNLMMRRWGGCSIIPSGTYFSEVPSTVLNEKGTVDGSALDLLDEMVEKYIPKNQKDSQANPSKNTVVFRNAASENSSSDPDDSAHEPIASMDTRR
jgi:glycosyltransferase involved in cell wall biosynthesis